MAFTTAALNAATDGIAGNITAISLHTADPSTTGASEVTGGTYARQTPTYGAASASSADITASLTFNIPAGTTVTHYGLWAGATFYGGNTLATSESYTGSGTYTLTSAVIDANAA